MYSLSGRLNSIGFNTLIMLTILSALNYFSVYYDRKTPQIIKKFEIKDYDTFVKDNFIGEDAISFTFDFKADLRPLFNWNTNLIFAYISCEYNTTKSNFNRITIWDQRIPRLDEQEHIVDLRGEYPEYYLTDINKQLRDTEVTCYLNWEQMPIVGANYGSRIEIAKFKTPKNYISQSRRKYHPGPENKSTNY